MHCKLKTAAGICKLIFPYATIVFTLILIATGLVSDFRNEIAINITCGAGFCILSLIAFWAIFSVGYWLRVDRTIHHKTIGAWYSRYLSNLSSHKPISVQYGKKRKFTDDEALQRLRKSSVQSYRIAPHVEIVFERLSATHTKGSSIFTIFCTPTQERKARRFADFLLSILFNWPNKYSFTVMIVGKEDGIWTLDESLAEGV
ncbi:MAG: hypothetical protein V4576_04220 [Patescibacteria group bacterium]